MVEHMPTDTDLPSWREGAARSRILEFVAGVDDAGVPPADRVAVFDNDGTLWCERPMPVQLHFIVERWAKAAERDPSLAEHEPYASALAGDFRWLGGVVERHYAGDDTDVRTVLAAIVADMNGLSVDEYAADVTAFLADTENPVVHRLFRELSYVPMLELVRYLERHGFTVYIASGGDRDFMRPFAPEIYGLSADRVIGSSLGLHWRESESGGDVVYGDSFGFLDDGPEKPVRIWSRVGKRPLIAGGNANGDIPMLRFAAGDGSGLGLLVHHDDDEREFAYDRGSERALAEAAERGWTVVSMRDDWTTVFAER
jgi:phosphoserine phosphatase